MHQFSLIRKIIVLIGDAIILLLALFLSLWIRDQVIDFDKYIDHLSIFNFLFIIWIIIFYLTNLYKLEDIIKPNKLLINLSRAILITITCSILFFYIVPSLRIAPKTILLILSSITLIFIFIWRIIFIKINQMDNLKSHILIIGTTESSKALAKEIDQNYDWGYKLVGFLSLEDKELYKKGDLLKIIDKEKIDTIVASFDVIKKNSSLLKELADVLEVGVSVVDTPVFYEKLTGKVPLVQLNQFWFLYNLEESERKIYEFIKRIFDIAVSIIGLVLLIISILILWIIELIIKDKGGLFYSQKRVGLFGKEFTIYKFRTMTPPKKKEQASWTKENDQRVTKIGGMLRKTRIDELPQVINILRGQMSFIGPRPERPEFTESLEKEIPFYNRRHIIRPGLTGWAQTQFRYGASAQDAYEKLQYDLYYIKNRSWFLDITILLRTITIILGFKGR